MKETARQRAERLERERQRAYLLAYDAWDGLVCPMKRMVDGKREIAVLAPPGISGRWHLYPGVNVFALDRVNWAEADFESTVDVDTLWADGWRMD